MLQRLCILLLLSPALLAQSYTCGRNGKGQSNIALTRNTIYTSAAGGFDLGMLPEQIDAAGCTSSKAFFFSAPVAEGNYNVTVVLGGAPDAVTTVRAESRRLMLARIATSAGQGL